MHHFRIEGTLATAQHYQNLRLAADLPRDSPFLIGGLYERAQLQPPFRADECRLRDYQKLVKGPSPLTPCSSAYLLVDREYFLN